MSLTGFGEETNLNNILGGRKYEIRLKNNSILDRLMAITVISKIKVVLYRMALDYKINDYEVYHKAQNGLYYVQVDFSEEEQRIMGGFVQKLVNECSMVGVRLEYVEHERIDEIKKDKTYLETLSELFLDNEGNIKNVLKPFITILSLYIVLQVINLGGDVYNDFRN